MTGIYANFKPSLSLASSRHLPQWGESNIVITIMSFLSKLFGGQSSALEKYQSELDEVNGFRDEIKNLSQEEIRKEIVDFRLLIAELKDKEDIKTKLKGIRPRVFALVREAAARTIHQTHFDVQIVGGFALADNRIAEMRTGEGKTLTATLALVLYALAGKGAHLVTVNDYLARWQASLMGQIYHYLGLSVASIQHEASFIYDPTYQPEASELEKLESETKGLVMDVKHMRPVSRKEAYAADITYGTNNEYGFDYLRDNMAQHAGQLAQRDLFFAIVDEVDSILIDEARTPLIISSPDTDPTDKYVQFAQIVERLEEATHYTIDEKHKSASLTDAGISKIEEILRVPNIYDTSKGVTTIHHIEQALRAKTLFKKDRDYVVREGEIIIVDEFTGRLMFGRRYSEGLHQAIEAKEGVKIQQESKTLATITFQNLFRLYDFLAGMTGTAKTEEEEFFKIYRLQVEVIPTNKDMIRIDSPDAVYKTEKVKFEAIAKEVKRRHETGQPILIGTVSIAKNEILAEVLKQQGLKFELLNAKNHEREAHIIAQAGRLGSITLATNIAGRGVDILLGGNPIDPEEAKAVLKAGGLHILGTERHESRRIDNQLRGRAGRQGDPGSSQFFVSMEDDLMRLFGGERMKSLMNTLGIPDDQPIEANMVSKSIESAQKKIEGLNFDTRKHVLEFDDVLNHQRVTIYRRRKNYVVGTKEAGDFNLQVEILDMVKRELSALVTYNFSAEAVERQEPASPADGPKSSIDEIIKAANTLMPLPADIRQRIVDASQNTGDREFAVVDELYKEVEKVWEVREREMGKEMFSAGLRYVALGALDSLWMEHLDTMDHLRDSVRLRGYGQRDPLVEYKKEGFAMFQGLIKEIDRQIVYMVFKISVKPENQKNQIDQKNQMNRMTDSATDPKYQGVGRNDPCPCGSGLKFKKCHGKRI